MLKMLQFFPLLLLQIYPSHPIKKPNFLQKLDSAGAIISGKVHKINPDHVVLKQVNFLKGCGPRTVAIKGVEKQIWRFKLDFEKDENFRVIVFACQDSANRRWWRADLGKGLARDSLEGEIRSGLDQLGICRNCCSFMKTCEKMEGVDAEGQSGDSEGFEMMLGLGFSI